MILSVLIGSLTKITYLPLLALQLLLVPLYWRRLRTFLPSLHPRLLNSSQWGILVLTFCLIAMNVELYGGNLVRYGAVNPKPSEVLSGDSLAVFNSEHDSTSRYAELRATRDSRPAVPLPMFAQKYVEAMMHRTLAVISHHGYALPDRALQLYQAVLLAMAATLLLRFRRLARHPCFLSVLLICLVYGLVLFAVNYRSYLAHHFFGAALQGRYIFPVLAPLVVLASHALLTGLRDAFKLLVIVFVGSAFVAGAFPTFMADTDDTWFISDEVKIFTPASSARPATVPVEWVFAEEFEKHDNFVGSIDGFAAADEIPIVRFERRERKDDMAAPHRTRQAMHRLAREIECLPEQARLERLTRSSRCEATRDLQSLALLRKRGRQWRRKGTPCICWSLYRASMTRRRFAGSSAVYRKRWLASRGSPYWLSTTAQRTTAGPRPRRRERWSFLMARI